MVGSKVVGGASVHLVQIVTVSVTTVSVMVIEVVVIVIEPEVLVIVTGHDVVVVKMISVVTTSEVAGVKKEVSAVAIELAEDGGMSVDVSEATGDDSGAGGGDGAGVEPGRIDVGTDSAGAVFVSVDG